MKRILPLLLLLPCILALVILAIVDDRVPTQRNEEKINTVIESDKQEDEKGSASKKSHSLESSSQDVISADDRKEWEIGVVESRWENEELLPIAIGIEGSLKEPENGAPIYKEPDEATEPIDILQYCAVVELHNEQNAEGWWHVKLIGEYTDGYVKEEFVEVELLPIGANDSTRNAIVKDALSYLGVPFVRYGKSLETGIDCSNFIQQIYKKNGIEIPNVPNDIAAAGYEITDYEAQPGDIVYYDKANNQYGHVGIFLGNGMIINCSGHSGTEYPKGGVRMCTIVYPDRESYKMINILDETDEHNEEVE